MAADMNSRLGPFIKSMRQLFVVHEDKTGNECPRPLDKRGHTGPVTILERTLGSVCKQRDETKPQKTPKDTSNSVSSAMEESGNLDGHRDVPKLSEVEGLHMKGTTEMGCRGDQQNSKAPLPSCVEGATHNTLPKFREGRRYNEWAKETWTPLSEAQRNMTTSDYVSGDIESLPGGNEGKDLMLAIKSGPPTEQSPSDTGAPDEATVGWMERCISAPNLVAMATEAPKPEKNQSVVQIVATSSIIHLPGMGEEAPSQSTLTISQEKDDLTGKVEEQTYAHLDTLHGRWVKTKGYEAAEKMLKEMPLQMVIITGDGDGATFIALKLLQQRCEDNMATPYELVHPEEWACVDRSRKAVVCLPDISGTICFHKKIFEKFMRLIEQKICPSMQKNGNVTLIVTLKKFGKKSIDMLGKYKYYVVDLQAKRYRLSDEEKEDLLRVFMEKYGVKICPHNTDQTIEKQRQNENQILLMSQNDEEKIIGQSETKGYMRRLEEFFSSKLFLGAEFFTKPRYELVKTIKDLSEQHKLALVAVHSANGKLACNLISQLADRRSKSLPDRIHKLHKDSKDIFKAEAGTRKNDFFFKYVKAHQMRKHLVDIEQHCQQLDGTLLKRTGNIFCFDGHAVENSLLVVLSEEFPNEVITTCSNEFFYNYIGVAQAFSVEECGLYVKVTSSDKERLSPIMIRMKEEISLKHIENVCNHSLMRESWFCERFLSFLKRQKTKSYSWLKEYKPFLWNALSTCNASRQNPYCMLYFGVNVMFRCAENGQPDNLCEMILKEGTWRMNRKKKKWQTQAYVQEEQALIHAVELNRETTVDGLVRLGAPIKIKTLLVAIDSGNYAIITNLLKHGVFSHREWCSGICQALKSDQKTSMKTFDIVTSAACASDNETAIQKMVFVAAENNDTFMFEQVYAFTDMKHHFKVDIDAVSCNGDSPLTIAVRKSHIELVQLLVEAGADQRNSCVKELPIHIAAKSGCGAILNILLNNDSSIVSEKDYDGQQALHLAVAHNSDECVKTLLGQEQLNIDAKDNKLQTPLHVAVEADHPSLVNVLVQRHANIFCQNEEMDTPFSLACKLGRYKCAEVFVTSNAHQIQNHALSQAIINDQQQIVQLLFKHGYNVNQCDAKYCPPLFTAIANGRHEMTEFLLKYGAPVTAGYNGKPPLHTACIKEDTKMMELLLDHGACLTTEEQTTGNNILHLAVEHNKPEMLEHIFKMKGSSCLVDMANGAGETALHTACQVASDTMVEILLKYGFSPRMTTWKNGEQVTPISLAQNGLKMASKKTVSVYRNIIKMLREH